MIVASASPLSNDVFIRADYAFSALETTFFRLMGYTSVLSNSNANSNSNYKPSLKGLGQVTLTI